MNNNKFQILVLRALAWIIYTQWYRGGGKEHAEKFNPNTQKYFDELMADLRNYGRD